MITARTPLARLIAVAITLTAAPTYAQEKLPEVQVTTTREGSAGGSLELERESTTGSRLGLQLHEQPAAECPGTGRQLVGSLCASPRLALRRGLTVCWEALCRQRQHRPYPIVYAARCLLDLYPHTHVERDPARP